MSDGSDRAYGAAQIPLYITLLVRGAALLVDVTDAENAVRDLLSIA